jgi:fatty-acyl-CoA synthase
MPDSYAGELPICYVQLFPGVTATEDELRAFAEAEIGERPAWPKEIRIVDAIPMTAVGKIFKPSLREDAVRRTVQTVLAERHLAGDVDVTVGGPRGMSVAITLANSDANDASQLQEVLDGYLFQATIKH